MKSSFHSKIIALVLILFVQISVFSQQLYFPSHTNWIKSSAKKQGLNQVQLNKAIDFAKANEYKGERDLHIAIAKAYVREPYFKIVGPTKERGGPAGIILRNGYMVAEWGDVNRIDMTFSVTKSYLATIAGLAVDEGLIKDTHDKMNTYINDTTFSSEHNSKITWHHLLTQSSDWSGNLFGMSDWADRPPKEGIIEDWKNRTLVEPGTVFEYNDVRVNLLSYSLLKVWQKPLPVILKEKIMDPIGASSTWNWYGYETSKVKINGTEIESVSGGGHSGGGLFINTVDHARFGLLFARNGNWNGQQLISTKWIEQMTQSSEANASYGYLWWLNRGSEKWDGVSEDIFYANGFGGNFIVIDRAHDLVIVTRWLDPDKIGEMVREILNAIEK
ncbi:MAG: serine hydrolase [Chryseolinea sp.]